MKTLGQRIKDKMNERGFKQADLSRESGISKAVISTILSAQDKDLRASSLYDLARALRCDPTLLYIGVSSTEWLEEINKAEAAEVAAKAANAFAVKQFGQRLEQKLQEMEMSISELARRAGLSKSVISNTINNPNREMQVSSLISIAKVLKVDPIWLYSGEQSEGDIK
ncbi:helix-turn-helix domain-containing protein [Aeromonas caviae]